MGIAGFGAGAAADAGVTAASPIIIDIRGTCGCGARRVIRSHRFGGVWVAENVSAGVATPAAS